MDYSPAEGSTSHILLLSDSVVQPSNSNSDTDVSTDTSIAATPQESGTLDLRVQSLSIVVTGAAPSLHILFDHIPTTTGAIPNPATTTTVPFQTTTTHTRRLPHHRELPLNRRLIHPNFHFCSVWWSGNKRDELQNLYDIYKPFVAPFVQTIRLRRGL